MDKRASYVGQLYRGEPQNKSWSLIVTGEVSVRLVEGEGRAGDWKLAAFKKDKVWECRLDPRIKFRIRNDFVQWQMKGGGGEPVTYGIRLKDSEAAAQLNDRITEVLNAMMSKPPEGDEVQLRVLSSSREPTLLTVRNSTTMIQILRMFCQKCQLDTTQFIIAPPPDSTHYSLKPSTTVGSLKTKEVQVVKKGSRAPPTGPAPAPPPGPAAHTEATDSNGLAANEQLVQVELPRDERTVVRVSPQTTISQLLKYICEKRNIELADHWFDLPATEESLAGKTLEQLRITAIRVVVRDEAKRRLEQQQQQVGEQEEQRCGGEGGSPEVERKSPPRTKRKSTRRNKIESSGESPKANRRQAPPPPPPLQSRRTQPNLVKELAVAAEKKATLRRMGQSLDQEGTPPEIRSTHTVNGAYHSSEQDKDNEYSMEGSPKRERKTKAPLLPSTSRTALLPRSYPPPPPPTSKATPTSDTAPDASTIASDFEASHKTVAPPPVAEKPKKKRATSLDDFDEPDHAQQAPPTKPEEEMDHPSVGVPTVDMDTLMEEAAAIETNVKKVKKKVKRKHSSDDTAAGTGHKEKKTKSGKSTKKKKKVSQQDSGELRQEESLDKEEPPQPQDNPELLPPTPAALPEEDILLPPEIQTEYQQMERHLNQQPAMSSLKQLSPNTKQRNTASLRRKPRGPAPLPPPPGSKTMTLGRMRPGEPRDVTVKPGRGFTVSAAERDNTGRPVSDEITTKPRSASEALPPLEKVENGVTSSVGTRHRPTRKAPSRPAPTTPQNKEKMKVDEGKTETARPRSLSGSPRRPPPNVPTAAAQTVPQPTTEADTVKSEDHLVSISGEVKEARSDSLPHEAAVGKAVEGDEALEQAAVMSTSSKSPSTPPRPKGKQRWSPDQSPSGRRKEAATVICKDTKDGGKELIVKPSPHSKRKLAGPLIFKMPPPPSAPPSKPKAKKPPPPISAKPVGKRDGTGSSEIETQDIYAESADSSVCESTGELASSMKASSPPKSLSDTLVSNEFTNLDELLSDSQQDNIATTDFSIEENLEPVDEYSGLEWNESGLADSDSIPYQDPDLEMAAALNFNSNNNNNLELEADIDYDYGDFPPPPEIPPPLSTRSAEDSNEEWEQDSNKTGELNFDSSSSAAELSKQSIEDGVVILEEEAGPGGVVLLNVKRMEDDDIPVLAEASEQDAQTGKSNQMTFVEEENAHLIPPASIPRDPSIGTQLNELDDVVSSLAELAAEVPSVPPPPPPPLFTPSQPHPITSSTPTQGEEHRSTSPEPPPIPLTLPPSLSDDEEGDDFPLGPPPPLVTSEPPSLTPSPPDSPPTDSRASPSQRRKGDSEKQEQNEEDRDSELLNRLKQRQVKGSLSRRRRRGSRDQEAVDEGESELLEKLKQRQTMYRPKARARRDDAETSLSAEQVGSHSVPPQQPGMGTAPGTGGDTVQLQLQFLQQQVLQQQMMQLQQQFHQLHNYAMQQGVSMPTNMMVPGVGGAMMNQQSAFMTTPMAPPTGVVSQPQHVMMQTSGGQVLVPATSMPQMMPGQGIMPNPQMMSQGQLPRQGFAPSSALPTQQQQQMAYGQGVPQPQTQLPLMSTSVATEQPMMYGQGVSQAPPAPPLPQTQPPVMSTSVATDLPSKQDSLEKPIVSASDADVVVTPARMSQKRRSEDVRAFVLGPLEDQFDSLMDQVRDADPTAVLKKIPEEVEDKELSSSYTGMAAALAEALKQRRLHVADKRRSLGDLDESTNSTSEWQSP